MPAKTKSDVKILVRNDGTIVCSVHGPVGEGGLRQAQGHAAIEHYGLAEIEMDYGIYNREMYAIPEAIRRTAKSIYENYGQLSSNKSAFWQWDGMPLEEKLAFTQAVNETLGDFHRRLEEARKALPQLLQPWPWTP